MTKLSLKTLHFPILVKIMVLNVAIILCVFELITAENHLIANVSVRLTLMMCVLNEIFLFSLFGQQLQDKSAAVCEKIYAADWLQFVNSFGKHDWKCTRSHAVPFSPRRHSVDLQSHIQSNLSKPINNSSLYFTIEQSHSSFIPTSDSG